MNSDRHCALFSPFTTPLLITVAISGSGLNRVREPVIPEGLGFARYTRLSLLPFRTLSFTCSNLIPVGYPMTLTLTLVLTPLLATA